MAKGPQRKQAGPKRPEEKVVNSWELREMESNQEWAKGTQRNELSK